LQLGIVSETTIYPKADFCNIFCNWLSSRVRHCASLL